MTRGPWRLIRLAAPWWVVLLVSAVCATSIIAIRRLPDVYFAETRVILLGPSSELRPNRLDSGSGSLIATAGIIESEMRVGRSNIPATSATITLLDKGVYDGEQVLVPNSGGQWAWNFEQPVLDLQASGPDADIVRERMTLMISQVDQILTRRQDAAGVARSERISMVTSPGAVSVEQHGAATGRAQAVISALGLIIIAVSTTGDRRARLVRRVRATTR